MNTNRAVGQDSQVSTWSLFRHFALNSLDMSFITWLLSQIVRLNQTIVFLLITVLYEYVICQKFFSVNRFVIGLQLFVGVLRLFILERGM